MPHGNLNGPTRFPTPFGQFVSTLDEFGRLGVTSDSHIPGFAISKLRQTTRAWSSCLGEDRPLNNRESIRFLGGMDFWANGLGRPIPDHIAGGALWRSTPTIIWYWVFQQYVKKSMGVTDSSSEDGPGGPFTQPHFRFCPSWREPGCFQIRIGELWRRCRIAQ